MDGRRVANMVAPIIIMVVMAAVLQSAKAESYKVGDSSGWIVPPRNNTSLYTDWASKHTFVVNDTLGILFLLTLNVTANFHFHDIGRQSLTRFYLKINCKNC